jgi:hypothetical protein
MVNCTALIPAALDEAAAIVEAEWMRLQQQVAASVDDHCAEPKESPAPRLNLPRVALDVRGARKPGPPSLKQMGCRLIRRAARREIWATERSPPGPPGNGDETIGGDT